MWTLKIDIYLMINYLCSTPRCHFLILVDSNWSLSLKWVDSGLFIFWLNFPWFILYRENVLGGTECACMVVWFRENVLIYTKCICRGVLFWENVLDGTKNSFARKWWGIQPLIKISSPEMSPFAEDYVITDIYICSLKQKYREICVQMQQCLCELHLCMDGWGESVDWL